MLLSLDGILLTLYAEPSAMTFHCPSNNADMFDTNNTVVSVVIIQEAGLPADVLEAINTGTDDGTHRSATDINVPATSANSNLRGL
jgi:hypothetical protein